MFQLVLTLSALFPLCFSRSQLESRIVNGIPIEASRYPWMVSLRQEIDIGGYLEKNSAGMNLTALNITADFNSSLLHHFCGASLIDIDPIIILTAAHCIDSFAYNDTENTFKYTEGNLTFETQIFADLNRTFPDDDVDGDFYQTLSITDPSSIRIHPSWTGSVIFDDDIALIILDDDQTVNGLSTAMLPTLPEAQLDGDVACCFEDEPLTAIGYGKNSTYGDGTETLEQTTLDFLSLTECSEATMSAYNFSLGLYTNERIMCVVGDNTDICQGDSGGPIVRDGDSGTLQMVGVTSFTLGECNSGTPSGYVSVAHYIDWIRAEAYGETAHPTTMPSMNPSDEETAHPTTMPSMNPSKAESYRVHTLLVVMAAVVAVYY